MGFHRDHTLSNAFPSSERRMHACVAFLEITEMVEMTEIQLQEEFDSDIRERCITLYNSRIDS